MAPHCNAPTRLFRFTFTVLIAPRHRPAHCSSALSTTRSSHSMAACPEGPGSGIECLTYTLFSMVSPARFGRLLPLHCRAWLPEAHLPSLLLQKTVYRNINSCNAQVRKCRCASSRQTSQAVPFNENVLHSLLGGNSTMAPVFCFHKSQLDPIGANSLVYNKRIVCNL